MTSPYEPPHIAEEMDEKGRRRLKRLKAYTLLILALTVASMLYRILVVNGYEQTALLFMGLPTILALFLVNLPEAKSVTGSILKGMTLFFLLLGILAIEGFICILMAAPLFYVIGLLIGIPIDIQRRKNEEKRRQNMIIPLVLTVLSLEGVVTFTSFERGEEVTRNVVIDHDADFVRKALSAGPADLVDAELPFFLKLGFPRPQEIEGGGLAVGDQWRIRFAGGEGNPGDLVAQLVEADENRYRWVSLSDTSHIAHWLSWKDATWTIQELGDESTRLTLSIRYDRELDPAWYFGPTERYAVGKTAEHFLETLFVSEEEF